MSPLKIYLELCPPVKSEDIPSYYDSFAQLLNKIAGVSIASHPAKGISGFERSANLVTYLRSKAPKDLKILFHITCNDVNKTNIKERYDQIIKLQVDHLLGITGDPYKTAVSNDGAYHPDLYFKNSGELIMALNNEEFTRKSLKPQQNYLPQLAVAAYPGSKIAKDEASRLMKKIESTKGNLIITQCLTQPQEFKSFVEEVMKGGLESSGLRIIPSVAIFDNLSSLNRSYQLTKNRPDQELVKQLEKLESKDRSTSQDFSLEYLIKLCRALLMIKSIDSIVLCAFDQFKMVEKLIPSLLANG